MSFGQRLKNLRLEHGYSQQALGRAVGVSTVTVRSWEYDEKKPSMDALIALSNFLGVSVDVLLDTSPDGRGVTNDTIVLSLAERQFMKRYRALDAHGQKMVNAICSLEKERMDLEAKKSCQDASKSERYIPRYVTPSAAGTSAPLDGEDFEMLLVDDSVPADADFAVNIQGDSMLPYIHDGDMVYVKKDAELSVGDVGIFCVDGAMYCKQYYVSRDGGLELLSANTKLRHTNVVIPPDSSTSIKCYGMVLLGFKPELPAYL